MTLSFHFSAMANLNHSRKNMRTGGGLGRATPFRAFDPNQSLEDSPYYEGFPCIHGHTLRHKEHQYCYYCAKKIVSNFVGLDISFVQEAYAHAVHKVLNDLTDISNFSQCCPETALHMSGVPRYCCPSWKNIDSKKRHEGTRIGKILYMMFWGDPGKLSVTRTCGNKTCCNPLHLTTSLNILPAPETLSYFDISYDPAKKMLMARRQINNQSIDELLFKHYKPRIADPKKLVEELVKIPNYVEVTWSKLQNNES